MKKLLSIALVLVMLCSFSISALAASTTTLTTTVPPAEYTLNIPADQVIPFGATSTDIGSVSVTDASSFAVGKNLMVTVNYSEFTSEEASTTIPFSMSYTTDQSINSNGKRPEKELPSGGELVFNGKTDGSVDEYIQAYYTYGTTGDYVDMNVYNVIIASSVWGKALAGDYTATITFTAEVVVEE